MAINLSTAGVHIKYATESTAGTRPTTGYTDLEGVKSIPSMNPSPENLDTTSLNEIEYKTSIPGLKDLGGALEFKFNLTEDFITLWETMMTAYETAKATNKQTWYTIEVPGLSKAIFFTGDPTSLGSPEMAVNSVLETSTYITPTNAPAFFAKATA